MNWTKESLRSFILTVVKPLKSGKAVSQKGTQATLDNLYPNDGSNDNFRLTSPFGFISKLPVGVTAFYQNLFGSGHESIVLGFLHSLRPEPSSPGESVLYSTTSDGITIKVKIVLASDGSLTITAPAKVIVNSPDVEIGDGALEKILNGEKFQTRFNQHKHLGNLGVPTGVPIDPSDAGDLSNTVKAAE